jgi:hypothetical protein
MISLSRHTVTRSDSLNGRGYFPVFTPAQKWLLLTGKSAGMIWEILKSLSLLFIVFSP